MTYFVYAVGWDDRAAPFVKIGFAEGPRRWRRFITGTGAQLLGVSAYPDKRAALDIEAALLKALDNRYPRAFPDAWSAWPFIGFKGVGFTECFAVPAIDDPRDLWETHTKEGLPYG